MYCIIENTQCACGGCKLPHGLNMLVLVSRPCTRKFYVKHAFELKKNNSSVTICSINSCQSDF